MIQIFPKISETNGHGYLITDGKNQISYKGWDTEPPSNYQMLGWITQDCMDRIAPDGVKEILKNSFEEKGIMIEDEFFEIERICGILMYL